MPLLLLYLGFKELFIFKEVSLPGFILLKVTFLPFENGV
jgi:hypothetical protein